MNYFTECSTLEEAKTRYHELIKTYHPDVYKEDDGHDITVQIIEEYSSFVETFYRSTASTFFDNSDVPEPEDLTPFTETLKQVLLFNCTVEIIGFWIYCFDSFEIRDELKEMGFWFSGKHKAWVYSGRPKTRRAGKESLDSIRSEKGSCTVKNREEQEKLTA